MTKVAYYVAPMQVWDGLSDARIIFDAADGAAGSAPMAEPLPHMARFVENVHLQRAMIQNLQSKPNVHLFGSTKVQSITSDHANQPIVSMDNGRSFKARLLVSRILFSKTQVSLRNVELIHDLNRIRLEQMGLTHPSNPLLRSPRPVGITTRIV